MITNTFYYTTKQPIYGLNEMIDQLIILETYNTTPTVRETIEKRYYQNLITIKHQIQLFHSLPKHITNIFISKYKEDLIKNQIEYFFHQAYDLLDQLLILNNLIQLNPNLNLDQEIQIISKNPHLQTNLINLPLPIQTTLINYLSNKNIL